MVIVPNMRIQVQRYGLVLVNGILKFVDASGFLCFGAGAVIPLVLTFVLTSTIASTSTSQSTAALHRAALGLIAQLARIMMMLLFKFVPRTHGRSGSSTGSGRGQRTKYHLAILTET